MYSGFMQVTVLGWHQSSLHVQSLQVTKPEQELRMLVIHASQAWVGNAGMLTELMTDTLWSLRALAPLWALWDTHLMTLLACTSVSYSSLRSWLMHIPQELRVHLSNSIFPISVVFCFCFRQGVTLYPMLAWNSLTSPHWRSQKLYFSLPSTAITGVSHHTQPLLLI